MLIPKAKFLSYQAMLYRKIMATPYTIELETITPMLDESDTFDMDKFVGDSPRGSDRHTFRALYEKDVSPRTRDKYGLAKEVGGVVYLSPKQLIPIYGDYHLDWNTTKIYFEGRTQVIDHIVYLEEFKEYKSCVGIQIFIKDDLQGG